MDLAPILDELASSKGFPRAALEAARLQRRNLAPQFVALIDSYLGELA